MAVQELLSASQAFKTIIKMKRILFLVALLLSAMQMMAADVDAHTARQAALAFLTGKAASSHMMVSTPQVQWLHQEMNAGKGRQAAYYIVNTDCGFVVVAGDDRAQQILAYGERPIQSLSTLPDNMKYWLDCYRRQMEFLQAHQSLQVQRPALNSPARAAQSVNPLLTANWSQNAPYWNECPVYGTDTCYTGCPATSLAMVFHYWKYPQQQTPTVPSYMTPQYADVLPELPPTVFDWEHMLDNYADGNYTAEQATAVAHLMRYIGQVEEMDYTISGSGAYLKDILRAVKFFEYDQGAQMVFKSDDLGYQNYSDSQWAALMQNELSQGRPIVYCAYDNATGAGHAFNVDGYDATTDTYHVNWGWNGRGNGHFALNAFSYGDYTFGTSQQMVIGIQPPEGYQNPRLQAYPQSIDMHCYINHTVTATVNLKGTNLTRGVTLTLSDAQGVFAMDAASLSADAANAGHDVTVTFAPTLVGEYSATITCTSDETDPVIITLHAVAPLEVYQPVMQPVNDAMVGLTSFTADWTDATPDGNVLSYTLEVVPKPAYAIVAEADFSDLPKMAPTNQASHATDYLPEGWSFTGSEFNLEGGCVMPRRNSVITTDQLNFKGYDQVTVVVTGRSYGTWGDPSELTVSTSLGSEVMAFPFNVYEPRTVVLDCAEVDQITFKCGYYPMIQSIMIYAGDATQSAMLSATEKGDDTYRLVENITTGKRYTVTGLTAAGTFLYKVKAHYIDGTESEWSNVEMVALHENAHAYALGDVNHDGRTDVADVSLLIEFILGKNQEACTTCANVDGKSDIDVADVSALIDIILGKQ